MFGGEIINADSMQVYRHFDIGTAKPDAASLKKSPHHLIDIVEAHEEFNAAMFREKADEAIHGDPGPGQSSYPCGRHRPLSQGPDLRPFHRSHGQGHEGGAQEGLRRRPADLFYEELKQVDHEYAMRISFRDKVRVVRAMEVFRLTGKPMSDLERTQGFGEPRYDMLKIGLKRERDELYRRINKRVDEMLAKGWVEEVKGLLSMGYDETSKPFSGIGYREIILYIKGLISHEDMVEEIKKNTRHYAKRQFTWFAKEKDVNWFRYPDDKENIRVKTAEFLKRWS